MPWEVKSEMKYGVKLFSNFSKKVDYFPYLLAKSDRSFHFNFSCHQGSHKDHLQNQRPAGRPPRRLTLSHQQTLQAKDKKMMHFGKEQENKYFYAARNRISNISCFWTCKTSDQLEVLLKSIEFLILFIV